MIQNLKSFTVTLYQHRMPGITEVMGLNPVEATSTCQVSLRDNSPGKCKDNFSVPCLQWQIITLYDIPLSELQLKLLPIQVEVKQS